MNVFEGKTVAAVGAKTRFLEAALAGLLLVAGCSGDSVGQASQDVEIAGVAETTSTVAGDASWVFVPPPTDAGTTTGIGDSGPSPEDATPPPEDATTPPEDATTPPEDATTPPEDATTPPEDATTPPEDATTPPEDSEPLVDSCDAVVCDNPPPGFCEGNMAVSYDEGECVATPTGATCVYAELTTLCSEDEVQFCKDGVCEGCTTDQQCNDALTVSVECLDELTTQFLSWKCEEGTCDSVSETVTCAGSGTVGCAGDVIQSTFPACIAGLGCQEVVLEDTVDCGALGQVCLDLEQPECVEPEDTCFTNEGCVSPPEGLCDEDTAISYPAQGNCKGAKDGEPGICVYPEELTPCTGDQLCDDGVCENPPCLWDYEPLHFDPCAIGAPTGPLLLTAGGTYTYNTDDGTLTGPDAVDPATEVLTTLDPEVRLMIVDRLEISVDTTLKVVGAMPLVVVSLDDMDIQGTVDVSSTLAQLGAGANPATCGSGTGKPGTVSGKFAGGGGGGGGLGGNGGDGASPDGGGGFGGDNGVKIAPPANIRGGCGGGSGAKNGGGDGGGGGGALYLAAQNSISISGVLHAGGAGGEGGDGKVASRSGGGGGGSGGYIGLEAPTVTLATNAVLAANGGGGGGGTDINQAGNGADGPAADAPAAAGGQGIENGGSGGIGAISGTPDGGAGLNKSDTRGAGGAGGGLGFIIVNSPVLMDQGAKLSGVAALP